MYLVFEVLQDTSRCNKKNPSVCWNCCPVLSLYGLIMTPKPAARSDLGRISFRMLTMPSHIFFCLKFAYLQAECNCLQNFFQSASDIIVRISVIALLEMKNLPLLICEKKILNKHFQGTKFRTQMSFYIFQGKHPVLVQQDVGRMLENLLNAMAQVFRGSSNRTCTFLQN